LNLNIELISPLKVIAFYTFLKIQVFNLFQIARTTLSRTFWRSILHKIPGTELERQLKIILPVKVLEIRLMIGGTNSLIFLIYLLTLLENLLILKKGAVFTVSKREPYILLSINLHL
jgi:hypothetical protein